MWDLLSYGGEHPDLLGWDTSSWGDSQAAFTNQVFNPRPPSGGGPSASETLSNLANQTEARLRANLQAYQAGAVSASDASAAGWQLLNQMVSQMLAAGSIGRKSAAERDRRIDPGMLRWDWIAYYLDPIPESGAAPGAAAPGPVYGGVQTAGLGGFAPGPLGGNNQLLLIAAVVVVVLLVLKK